MRVRTAAALVFGSFLLHTTTPGAQDVRPNAAPARAIEPDGVVLPKDDASANERRFSFIAYGDTRGPADGQIPQPAHREVLDLMRSVIEPQRRAGFPVRFVVHSGDGVVAG